MNFYILLFEVAGEFPSVRGLYTFFIIVGAVGLILGFWRWWASAIWLLFPTSLLLFGHFLINIDDINMMWTDIVRELGEIYIWHNYTAMTLCVVLNMSGIFIKFFKPKKFILQ